MQVSDPCSLIMPMLSGILLFLATHKYKTLKLKVQYLIKESVYTPANACRTSLFHLNNQVLSVVNYTECCIFIDRVFNFVCGTRYKINKFSCRMSFADPYLMSPLHNANIAC